jgi:PAS domain S-box-containing protein
MGNNKEKRDATESVELRSQAEARLEGKIGKTPSTLAEADALRLLHELDVHRIELEMQNAELRRARDKAETDLEKYADLYDFAPVGYFTLDRAGVIRGVNLTGASLLGVERSRLINRRFPLFIAQDARPAFTACLGKLFENREKKSWEAALLKEGSAPLFVQIEGVAAPEGEECRLAIIDITGRREAEEALLWEKEGAETLRLDKEGVEAISRSKSRFLANMSHELRTPMTGILGMLQIALEEEIAPAPRECLETALFSARSLLRILNDLLDMARIEAGKLSIEEKPFSPHKCVTETVDIITSEAQRKGLVFTVSVADDVPEMVIGDHERLRQILINLIGNAVKFTESGEVAVQVSAGAPTSGGKREFNFSVKDTGIGIADDKKELLFRTFSQIDDSRTRSFGGAGLGLVISRDIAGLMGGTISFTSEEGEGSTFTLTLPFSVDKRQIQSMTESAAAQATSPLPLAIGERRIHLLIAEDDATVCTVLGLMLRKHNFDAEFASDGRIAVEMWEKGDYDLVIMDGQMPVMDGLEATRRIRELERERGGHVPIIAITAHAFKEYEDKCLAAGMDAYISKPIDFSKCMAVIRKLLNHSV